MWEEGLVVNDGYNQCSQMGNIEISFFLFVCLLFREIMDAPHLHSDVALDYLRQ